MAHFISKVMKFKLLALFVATVASFISFYFVGSMPDNFLAISSANAGINYFTYYLTSLVALVGYYSGPWIVAPFVLYAVLYSLVYSHRKSLGNAINGILIYLAFLSAAYLFAPSLLGQGIHYILKNAFGFWAILAGGVLTLLVLLRGSYKHIFNFAGSKHFAKLSSLKGHIESKAKNPLAKVKGVFARKNTGRAVESNDTDDDVEEEYDDEEEYEDKYEDFEDEEDDDEDEIEDEYDDEYDDGEEEDEDEEYEDEYEDEYDDYEEEEDEKEDEIPKPKFFSLARLKKNTSRAKTSPPKKSARSIAKSIKSIGKTTKKTIRKSTPSATQRATRYSDGKYYSLVSSITHKAAGGAARHPSDAYFKEIVGSIEEKLAEFRIDGTIIGVLKGPVVDTFELQLGSGIKVSKVTSAEKEISMALLGAPIRIIYPMMGRPTVGIEVPRNPREIIFLADVFNSKEYKKSSAGLPIAMGKDAFGETFVVDLTLMPHMLVAGSTGSGKSVFINSLLVSLLVKKSPNQMKLILIDPKQLELALYQNLPHLMMPVVTDARTAGVALTWAVHEMERRYAILKEFGVRSVEGFNIRLKKAPAAMVELIRPLYPPEEKSLELPFIVVVIDEFADLILTRIGKEIEGNICRLAAKARAAGIHLVVATQRPSVDVITGLIKSNFPTRVSFRVTSAIDSRTILTHVGAEKLLGRGDMLYKHGTMCKRVHSAFIEEDEIEELTAKLSNVPQHFNQGAMEMLEEAAAVQSGATPMGFAMSEFGSPYGGGENDDELLRRATEIVLANRSASTSMLQRHLKIGYNRAANLIDELEAKGIIGPAEGIKRRKVLLDSPK